MKNRPLHPVSVPVSASRPGLKELLDRLAASTDASYLSLDPLEIVRRYRDPLDLEVAGLFAAMLSLGRAELIRRAAAGVLDRMGPSPGRFVRRYDPVKKGGVFRGFVYRFFGEKDLDLLSWRLRTVLAETGTVGRAFSSGFSPEHPDVGPALSAFVRRLTAIPVPAALKPAARPGSGLRHFLADPAEGSACKRLNLYLRWMVRRDGLDLGLWRDVPASKLVIPLDTHVARFGRRLGLTRRSAADWKMALEITAALRAFDPADPVKYDFALCTAGKLRACPDPSDPGGCSGCPFGEFCVLRPGGARA
jgi:uncharacterized protein (TIGR02757 family)